VLQQLTRHEMRVDAPSTSGGLWQRRGEGGDDDGDDDDDDVVEGRGWVRGGGEEGRGRRWSICCPCSKMMLHQMARSSPSESSSVCRLAKVGLGLPGASIYRSNETSPHTV
jgi:hypothetical protein